MKEQDPSALRRRGQALRAALQVGRQGLSASFLEEVRAQLRRHAIVKVRLHAENAAAARTQAEELATSLPAQLVEIRGHKVLLARERARPRSPLRGLK